MSRAKQPKGTKEILQTQLIVRSSTAARSPEPVIWDRE
jgi:hypothetical protein